MLITIKSRFILTIFAVAMSAAMMSGARASTQCPFNYRGALPREQQ